MCGVHRDRLRTVLGYERSEANKPRGVVVRVKAESVHLPSEHCSVEKVWVQLLDDRRRGSRSAISEPGETELLTTRQSGMCAARHFQRAVANNAK